MDHAFVSPRILFCIPLAVAFYTRDHFFGLSRPNILPRIPIQPRSRTKMQVEGSKKPRQRHRKSRDGCTTCKKRHIKCDEKVSTFCL